MAYSTSIIPLKIIVSTLGIGTAHRAGAEQSDCIFTKERIHCVILAVKTERVNTMKSNKKMKRGQNKMKSKQCQQQNKTLEQNMTGTSANFAKLLLKIKIYWLTATGATRAMRKVSLSSFIITFNSATHI